MASDLFVCDDCSCCDLVTLAYPNLQVPPLSMPKLLCSECGELGVWHRKFAKRPYKRDYDMALNRPNGVSLS